MKTSLLCIGTIYLGRRYKVTCYLYANNIIRDFDKVRPDVCLIDYRLPGNKNGIDSAIEILNRYPSMPILIITAYTPVNEELSKNSKLQGSNIGVLLKPVRLSEIEKALIELIDKTNLKLTSLLPS